MSEKKNNDDDEKSRTPFVHTGGKVVTTWATIGLLLAGFGSWILLRAQVNTQGEKQVENQISIRSVREVQSEVKANVLRNTEAIIETKARIAVVEQKIAADHDILVEIRHDLKALRRDSNPAR